MGIRGFRHEFPHRNTAAFVVLSFRRLFVVSLLFRLWLCCVVFFRSTVQKLRTVCCLVSTLSGFLRGFGGFAFEVFRGVRGFAPD